MPWQDIWEQVQTRVALEAVYYDNTVREWLIALGIAVAGLILFPAIHALLVRRAAKIAERTEATWDNTLVEAFRHTRFWFLLILALYCGSLALELAPKTRDVIEAIAILTLLGQAAIWGNTAINVGLENYARRRQEKDPAAVTTVSALSFIGKLSLFAVLVLLALDNVGVEVTALIAGLGIGGIALALASQSILGDLFASVLIALDKPFLLGDFIIVGDFMGNVEKIGLKTTRLRGLGGEQLLLSNNDLLQSRIRNFKRMVERRILFSLGVTYDTPREKLTEIPAIIRQVIEAQPDVRFDRAHLKEFGAYSLNFEVVYYVLSPDYNQYMDRQHAINLAIYERFAENGIEFAFPTQTVLVEGQK